MGFEFVQVQLHVWLVVFAVQCHFQEDLQQVAHDSNRYPKRVFIFLL
jgi:hypothetical protein